MSGKVSSRETGTRWALCSVKGTSTTAATTTWTSSHTNLASHGRTGKEGPFKGKALKVPWVVMYLRARRYTVKAWCFLGSTVSSFNLHT